jgi:hypothetical protein
MIFYLKDRKNVTKPFVEIINTFGKVAGYKINIQNPVDFLYTTMSRLRKKSGKQSYLQ